ncbi:unnamed protein product [Blepharisma stoltei]|uniref:Uncharacterized protein n=1 Tax=Blepharisma stoltei TaxID=1481888 RepID=A0AAU9JD31_9CILI|nr:unnamed protein product [Blepharisma stoltei]
MGLFTYARQISRAVYACKMPAKHFSTQKVRMAPLIPLQSSNFLISTPFNCNSFSISGSSLIDSGEDDEEKAVESSISNLDTGNTQAMKRS